MNAIAVAMPPYLKYMVVGREQRGGGGTKNLLKDDGDRNGPMRPV